MQLTRKYSADHRLHGADVRGSCSDQFVLSWSETHTRFRDEFQLLVGINCSGNYLSQIVIAKCIKVISCSC